MRDELTADARESIATTAADALVSAWPADIYDSALEQSLRANTAALVRHSENVLYHLGIHLVLFRFGESLGEYRQFAAARRHFEHMTGQAAAMLGPDHADTLATRADPRPLAGTGEGPAGAATDLAEVLKDQLRVLGPDHSDTLAARADLARWRGGAGDVAGAITALTELLTDRFRVLGPDHPDTLSTRASLAYWQGRGRASEGCADQASPRFIADRLRILGLGPPGHAADPGQPGPVAGTSRRCSRCRVGLGRASQRPHAGARS